MKYIGIVPRIGEYYRANGERWLCKRVRRNYMGRYFIIAMFEVVPTFPQWACTDLELKSDGRLFWIKAGEPRIIVKNWGILKPDENKITQATLFQAA